MYYPKGGENVSATLVTSKDLCVCYHLLLLLLRLLLPFSLSTIRRFLYEAIAPVALRYKLLLNAHLAFALGLETP